MNKFLKLGGKIILILVAVLGVVFIGIRIYFFANSGDDELLDNSHLALETINISDDKNGWFDLKKAEELMYYPEDKEELIRNISDGKSWDQSFVDELMDKNKESLVYSEKGLKKEMTGGPLKNSISSNNLKADTVLDGMSFCLKLNRINLISAINKIRNDKFNEGLDNLILSINFTEKTKKSNISLLDYLIELSLKSTTHKAIKNIIDEVGIHKNESILLQNALEKNKENKDSLARSFKGEYWSSFNSLNGDISFDDLSESNKKIIADKSMRESSFHFKPNKLRNDLNKMYSRNVENSYQTCDNLISFKGMESFNEASFLKVYFTENAMGKIIARMNNTNLDSAQKKRCAEDFDIIALQVELASSAYGNDFKKYPENILEMRKSGYLIVDVPDNLNGWELIYDKENGELEKPKELESI